MSNPEASQRVVLTLKSGEQIQIEIDEDGRLGVDGYRIRVLALSGRLLVQPRSDNRIDVLTFKSAAQEEAAVTEAAAVRRASTPAKR